MHYMDKINKVHCFSCGCNYDLIDIIGLKHNAKNRKEAFRIALGEYIGTASSDYKPIKKKDTDENEKFLKLRNERDSLREILDSNIPLWLPNGDVEINDEYEYAVKRLPYVEYLLDCMCM